MKKRLSVRFDLDREIDRKVWEWLEKLGTRKGRAVITALNSYLSKDELVETVRATIRECLQGVSFAAPPPPDEETSISKEEAAFFDCLSSFMHMHD